MDIALLELVKVSLIVMSEINFFFMPPNEESGGGHINLPLVRPSVRPFVRPDIDTWFVRLSPPTVLELQL
jgi:hypothetical protein